MRTWGTAAWRLLAGCSLLAGSSLLAGCGDSSAEDFAIEIKRPAATVYAPLSSVDLKDARMLFPGIVVERSRPSDTEILYTIPGSGDFPATIRFQLEPKADGATTLVHAFVHVPAVRATIDGVDKQVSEKKVEIALQGLVKATASSLEMGSGAGAESIQLSGFMAGIAIATNKTFLAKALTLKDNPSQLMGMLLAFDAPRDQGTADIGGREIRPDNPDAAQAMRDSAQAQTEWKRQEMLDKAAAPTSNLESYDN